MSTLPLLLTAPSESVRPAAVLHAPLVEPGTVNVPGMSGLYAHAHALLLLWWCA